MSRLHRVVQGEVGGRVTVADVDGVHHVVSLLALEGGAPQVGDWLVVHSGYAIDRVDAAEAMSIVAELDRFRAHVDRSDVETTKH